jgi:pilus assembly protein CpaF
METAMATRLATIPFGRRAGDFPARVTAFPAAGELLPRKGARVADPGEVRALLQPLVAARFDPATDGQKPRGELAEALDTLTGQTLEAHNLWLDPRQRRDLVSGFLGALLSASGGAALAVEAGPTTVLPQIHAAVMAKIDPSVAARMGRGELARRLTAVVTDILADRQIALNGQELRELVTMLLDDMLGLGPLEPLLADDSVTDIMVNGPAQVYVERGGKLEVTGTVFRDNNHVMQVATRIVAAIGRRIDEATPLVDARLADGSRVNIIVPPLALDGPTISIRKFAKRTLDLDAIARSGGCSPAMAALLKVAARCRLNILVSGGTGSGKTTLLNALSRMIDPGERIVTIEDAAELQLQQPHVVRLETRPPNLEGRGEIGMRELVRNALRMRPDRIIIGEIRGAEALDMLQAMNTGHDGSLGTIHANRPREALTRLENMVGMTGIALPVGALRTQIAAAVNLIVQVARMRDGVRRITSIAEVVGMEGDVIVLKELFAFRVEGGEADGTIRGRFESSGLRPDFASRAAHFGLSEALAQAVAA